MKKLQSQQKITQKFDNFFLKYVNYLQIGEI